MKRTLNTIFISIVTLITLSSCNTAIGLGRDMRVLGTEMEKKAEEKAGGHTSDDQSGAPPIY